MWMCVFVCENCGTRLPKGWCYAGHLFPDALGRFARFEHLTLVGLPARARRRRDASVENDNLPFCFVGCPVRGWHGCRCFRQSGRWGRCKNTNLVRPAFMVITAAGATHHIANSGEAPGDARGYGLEALVCWFRASEKNGVAKKQNVPSTATKKKKKKKSLRRPLLARASICRKTL